MRREERVTVQGPVKEQQPDGMSHRGGRYTCGYFVVLAHQGLIEQQLVAQFVGLKAVFSARAQGAGRLQQPQTGA